MDRRRQHYQAAADFCIDTSETTPEAAAAAVMDLLAKGTIPAQNRAPCISFFKSGRIPPKCMERLMKVLADNPADPLTRLMGVAGYPCAHSKGPHLFNALFDHYGLDYHYTWFEDPELDEILSVARHLDVKGLSVTIPFKQEIIPLIDEVEEHAAQQIGAVNTVIFSCGTARGYNTDWIGVRKPLVDLKGSKAVLLGAGGAAAGAAFALVDLDMDVTILNRTPAKAKVLAERFGCKWGELADFDAIKPDVVVNSTPLGMNTGRPEPAPRRPAAQGDDGLRPCLHPAGHPPHRGCTEGRVHHHHRDRDVYRAGERTVLPVLRHRCAGREDPGAAPMNTFGRNFTHHHLWREPRQGARVPSSTAARPVSPLTRPTSSRSLTGAARARRPSPRPGRRPTGSRSSPGSLKERPPARPSR